MVQRKSSAIKANESVTVLGGHGFIGSHYVQSAVHPTIAIPKPSLKDFTKNVINFVSTTDNYNLVNGEPLIDIATNLMYLVSSLEAWRQVPDAYDGCYNYVSSWYVYGGIDNQGVSEEKRIILGGTKPQVNGFHSITKATAEAMVIDFCTTYGLPYRILRPGTVIGHDPKTSEKKNAIQHMIIRIRADEDVVVYDARKGEYFRDFILAADVAGAINRIMHAGAKNEIFNIGNGKPPMNIIEILEYMKGYCGSRSKITVLEVEDKQTSIWLNIDKIKGLGYVPFQERKDTVAPHQLIDYKRMFESLV